MLAGAIRREQADLLNNFKSAGFLNDFDVLSNLRLLLRLLLKEIVLPHALASLANRKMP